MNRYVRTPLEYESEMDALRIVLAGYVRDLERAKSMIEAWEMEYKESNRLREVLMNEVQELRNAWTASRHYKRLRQYAHRTQNAEEELRVAKDEIARLRGMLGD